MRQNPIAMKIPARAFGYSFWWAWVFLVLFPRFAIDQARPSNLEPLSLCAGIVTFLVVTFLMRTVSTLQASRSYRFAAAAISVIGTALILFTGFDGHVQLVAMVIGSCLAGAGNAATQLLWGEMYATLDTRHVIPAVFGSFLLALLMCFLLFDKGIVGSFVTLALPVATVAFAKMPEKDTDGLPEAPLNHESSFRSTGVPFSKGLLVFIVLYGFAFGIMGTLFGPDSSFASQGLISYYLIVNAVAAGIIFIISLLLPEALTVNALYRVLLPLLVVGVFIYTIFGFANGAIAWTVIIAGMRCADMFVWAILTTAARKVEKPFLVYSWGCGGTQTGILLGTLLGLTLPTWIQNDSQFSTILVFVLLVFVVGYTFLPLKQIVKLPLSAERVPHISSQNTLEGLVQKVGLSPREREIFEYLCKGRTVAYTAQELNIAPSTATTHTHNIYHKLGIHNRQELLTLVENITSEKEDTPRA